MARKGRNIYKRKDGRWEGRVRDTDGKDGKYVSFYGHSYNEVKEKMERFVPQKKPSGSSKDLTVEEALEQWVQGNENAWKPSTRSCYIHQIRKFLIPELGNYKCSHLNNQILQEFVQRHGELSRLYLKNICGLLQRSIRYVNLVYECEFHIPEIQPNALGAKRKEGTQKEIPAAADLARLENYLLERPEDDTCLGILLAMYTGIRIGELCALKWENICLEEGCLTVARTLQRVRRVDQGEEKDADTEKTEILVTYPKSASSMRKIPIPAFVLRQLRSSGAGKSGCLIRGKKKEYAEPRTVQYRFGVILKQCGLSSFNFHQLRHVFASRCLQQGFDCKTLSELLGHSSVQITMNTYVHSSEERKKKLMERLTIHEVA